jgi:TetR/AcrR family transcriptional repressor of nem operon
MTLERKGNRRMSRARRARGSAWTSRGQTLQMRKRTHGGARMEAKRATRETLLDAGLDEIIEHGLDAGLEGICARAGYTRGAFYVHFKNREDFLLALIERVLNAIVDSALNVDREAGVAGTVGVFSQALEMGIWPLVPKIRVATVRLVDATERWPAIRAAFDGFLSVAIERLTYGAAQDQAAGRIRRDIETRDLATLLVTLAVGTIVLANTTVRPAREQQRALLVSLIASAERVGKA